MGDALIGWLLGLFLGSISVELVAAHLDVDRVQDIADESLTWFALSQAGLWVGLMVMPVVVARTKGNGLVSDFGLRARPVDVPAGGGWGLVTQLLLIPLLYLPIVWFGNVDTDDIGKPARDMAERADDVFGVVMLVLIVGIVAPIVEEIFYRGLLQRSLQRRLGMWPGLLITSVVFGVVHLQPLQLPALILAGFVFGLLTQRSGRLGPAIVAHMVFNLVAVATMVQLS